MDNRVDCLDNEVKSRREPKLLTIRIQFGGIRLNIVSEPEHSHIF